MRKLLAFVLALVMVLALTACGGNSSANDTGANNPGAPAADTGDAPADEAPAAPAEAGGQPSELHIVPPELNTNLDIMMNTTDSASLIVSGSVFEQLVTVNENYEPIPELAESWEINADSTEYVYHLREGVKFHNGETMTAEDVVASLNRWVDGVEAVNTFVGGAHFEAVDDLTVKIELPQSFAYLNNLMGTYANRPIIVPASVLANIDDTGLLDEFVGTGPYMLTEIREDQYVKLEKFADYQPYGTDGDFSGWGGYKNAYIDTIYFDFVSDENTILSGLQTGQFQATSGIGNDSYDQFASDDRFEVTISGAEMPMMIFNKAEGLASDAAFRRGINAALNVDEILYGAYGSQEFYTLNSSYMFPSQDIWYTDAGSEYYNQADADKAVEILTEAGYDFTEPFKILVASDSPDFYNMAVVIQYQLMNAGIPCDLMTYDWSTFVEIRNNEPDQYNAFITSFSVKTVPSMNLYLSTSWAGWCTDERIQDDLAAINASATAEDGAVIWKDLQEYMWADYMPVVNFGIENVFMINSTDVQGLGYQERIVFVNAYLAE